MQYSPFDSSPKILDMEKYNGRVNIAEVENPETRFSMFEKTAIKNKATEYRDPLGNDTENTVLSQLFFSSENIQIIQNGIKAGVYNRSNREYILPNQNLDELKIIMRSIFLQYAKYRSENITGQIEELNKLVLDYAIPYCYNESVAYLKYIRDQSSLAVPLEREKPLDRDFKELEQKPWF